MDFGKILEEWETRQPQSGKEPQNGKGKPPQPVKPQGRNPLETWLRENEVPDKDAEMTAAISPAERRRRLRAKKPDAVIDLHGLLRNEAWDALERFFNGAQANGYDKLLIIHGKGNHSTGEAVLKKVVEEFLDSNPAAGERGHHNSGDTWVILKF